MPNFRSPEFTFVIGLIGVVLFMLACLGLLIALR
jgi:hypothetical protein